MTKHFFCLRRSHRKYINFAAKLLGKTAGGKLLFGYARLPGENYIEPALSPLPPSIAKKDDGYKIAVQVQNFGQIASKPAPIEITAPIDGQETKIVNGTVPALQSFEKTTVELVCGNLFKAGVTYRLNVMIDPDGQRSVTLERSMAPNP